MRRSKGSLVSSIRGILYARAKSSSTRKGGGKMMTEMTLAVVVPNKIRARSRRLRHVIHEQGEPSSSSWFVGGGVGGGVVVAHRRRSLDGALAK